MIFNFLIALAGSKFVSFVFKSQKLTIDHQLLFPNARREKERELYIKVFGKEKTEDS